MSSKNELIKSYEQRIKQLEEELKEVKLKEKPVTQNIANQHIIQGNNINNSNLNANVNQHGNSLDSKKKMNTYFWNWNILPKVILEKVWTTAIGNPFLDEQNDGADDKFNYLTIV